MIAKEVMRHIDGVAIFPLVSLILFFVLFSATIIYAYTMNKDKAAEYSSLPLEKDQDDEIND